MADPAPAVPEEEPPRGRRRARSPEAEVQEAAPEDIEPPPQRRRDDSPVREVPEPPRHGWIFDAPRPLPPFLRPGVPTPRKHIVRYQTLSHGDTPNKSLVLVRCEKLEIYMHKHKTSGEIGPCKYDRCLPESRRLKLPNGMSNNFANWNDRKVMKWARQFIPREDYPLLYDYHYTGLDIFYITRRLPNEEPLYFKKLSPEATTPMMIEPRQPPADTPPLPPRIMEALCRNINKMYNLLHGFRIRLTAMNNAVALQNYLYFGNVNRLRRNLFRVLRENRDGVEVVGMEVVQDEVEENAEQPLAYVVRCQELSYGRTEDESQLLITAGPIEMYMTKNIRTLETRPAQELKFLPEARCIQILPGSTNNFADWSRADVITWVRRFNPEPEELEQLRRSRLDGIGLYCLVQDPELLRHPFWKRSEEGVQELHLEEPHLERLPQRLEGTLRLHLNKLYNLLNGHR